MGKDREVGKDRGSDGTGGGMELNPQEVATCCRIAMALMGGRGGPRFSQVRLETLFVRDGDFLYDLAREMSREIGGIMARYHEIKRDNEASNRENAAKRRLRSEAVVVASDVVDVMRHLSTNYPERWQYFQKMIAKQTLRQIVRRSDGATGPVIRDGIEWCSSRVEQVIGAGRLETLLTFRSTMP